MSGDAHGRHMTGGLQVGDILRMCRLSALASFHVGSPKAL